MKYIGIIDDHAEFRQSIEDYLDVTGNYKVVFSIESFIDFHFIESNVSVDYIILDVYLGDANGIEILGLIRKVFADASIIVITGNIYDDYILSRAVGRGAASVLFKPFAMQDLMNVFSQIDYDFTFLLPSYVEKVSLEINQQRALRRLFEVEISPTEARILNMLWNNFSRKEIAKQVNFTLPQVNTTITRLTRRAECDNVRGLMQKIDSALSKFT